MLGTATTQGHVCVQGGTRPCQVGCTQIVPTQLRSQRHSTESDGNRKHSSQGRINGVSMPIGLGSGTHFSAAMGPLNHELELEATLHLALTRLLQVTMHNGSQSTCTAEHIYRLSTKSLMVGTACLMLSTVTLITLTTGYLYPLQCDCGTDTIMFTSVHFFCNLRCFRL